MTKSITFTSGGEEVTLTVQNVQEYPKAQFNVNGTFLHIKILKTDHNYSDVEKLYSISGDVAYKEDGVVMMIYKGYDFSQISGNITSDGWELILSQKDLAAQAIQNLQDSVAEIMEILTGMMG